jgi:hypothetical protein
MHRTLELLEPAHQLPQSRLGGCNLPLFGRLLLRSYVERDGELVRVVVDPGLVGKMCHDPFLLYVALHVHDAA